MGIIKKMTVLPHGTTIENREYAGHHQHLVCSPGGALCRYAYDLDQAHNFADLYEELYSYK